MTIWSARGDGKKSKKSSAIVGLKKVTYDREGGILLLPSTNTRTKCILFVAGGTVVWWGAEPKVQFIK